MVGNRRSWLNEPANWLGLVAVIGLLALQGFSLRHDQDDHNGDHSDEPCQTCVVIAVEDDTGLPPPIMRHLVMRDGLLTLEQARPVPLVVDLDLGHSARGPPPRNI